MSARLYICQARWLLQNLSFPESRAVAQAGTMATTMMMGRQAGCQPSPLLQVYMYISASSLTGRPASRSISTSLILYPRWPWQSMHILTLKLLLPVPFRRRPKKRPGPELRFRQNEKQFRVKAESSSCGLAFGTSTTDRHIVCHLLCTRTYHVYIRCCWVII